MHKHADRNTAAWKRLRKQVIREDGLTCRYCGKQTREDVPVGHPDKTTVDHIIPIAYDGMGALDRDNCVVCCWLCNIKKKDRMPGTPSKKELAPGTSRPSAPLKTSRDWKSPA